MQLIASPRRLSLPSAVLLFFFTASPPLASAQGRPLQEPAATMEAFFNQMADNAGPMAPMFGRLTDAQIAQLDAVDVTIAEESAYGRRVLDGFIQSMKAQDTTVTTRFPEAAYLRKLISTIQPQMLNANRYPRIQIHLIEADSEDAYSVPGGNLLVTRGLLERIESEAALVGVLSHELSHLDRGHQLLPLKQSKLARQPLDFSNSMMLVSLVARPFRPEQESQADADACKWMMSAGYQPLELARLLDRWNNQQDQQAPWQNFVPGFVKSHPDAGVRTEQVARLADNLRVDFPNATYVGRENLKRRIPKSEKLFP